MHQETISLQQLSSRRSSRPPARGLPALATIPAWRQGSRARPERRRHTPHVQSFMGSLELVPGWLSWPLHQPESALPLPAASARRIKHGQKVRDEMASCRVQLPIKLPPPPPDPADGDARHQQRDSDESSSSSSSSNLALPSMVPARDVQLVLPWLYAACGGLDLRGVEHLASCDKLHSLMVVDLSKRRQAWLPAGLHWFGSTPTLGPALGAAAALRRYARHQGVASGGPQALLGVKGHSVLLVYGPDQVQLAVETLALFLHLYAGMELEDAAQCAYRGIDQGRPPALHCLQKQCAQLAAAYQGWRQRVELSWRYSGSQVDVVGDAVGSWDARVPLVFDVARKLWRVQLWGLPPGRHRYKFIVDGSWNVDLAAPTETDIWGNVNNVVVVPPPPTALPQDLPASDEFAVPVAEFAASGGERVHPPPAEIPPESYSAEQAYLARLGAALLAMYNRLPSQKRPARSPTC